MIRLIDLFWLTLDVAVCIIYFRFVFWFMENVEPTPLNFSAFFSLMLLFSILLTWHITNWIEWQQSREHLSQ